LIEKEARSGTSAAEATRAASLGDVIFIAHW
jgi:hypothetical protein